MPSKASTHQPSSSSELIRPPVPTHLITGLLGAGKTSVMLSLMEQKPAAEVWVVLVNEFGRLALDKLTIEQQQSGIIVKEITGGCLCCTTQLNLQITLVQAIKKYRPNRIFIEPSGLAHPQQIIDTLTEAHWQDVITLEAVTTVFNGKLSLDKSIIESGHETAFMSTADILLINHADELTLPEYEALEKWLSKYPEIKIENVHFISYGQTRIEWLWQTRQNSQQSATYSARHISELNKIKSLQMGLIIHPDINQLEQSVLPSDQVIEKAISRQEVLFYDIPVLNAVVAGAILPKQVILAHDELLNYIFQLKEESGFLRMKGLVHTNKGWLNLNVTPQQMDLQSAQPFDSSLIEVTGQTDFKSANQLEVALKSLIDSSE